MKYVVCISARAKDRLDSFRLAHGIGRFPVRHLFHGAYKDNRPERARASNTFSLNMRPVTLQTVVAPEKIIDVIDAVDAFDVITRYDKTDAAMLTHILGTFLDAVVLGHLIDATYPDLPTTLPLEDRDEQIDLALLASEYNLQQATLK
jgi:hypothetical protein